MYLNIYLILFDVYFQSKLFIQSKLNTILQEVNITTITIYIRTLEIKPKLLGVDNLNLELLRGGAHV